MAADDPPRRKPDWRAPDTGHGPDTGEGPEVGHGPEVGERPDTGRGPEVGPRPDTGKSPEVGTRPDTGESSKFGRGPEVGPCPDTGRGPEVGPRPDFGESPDVGESPDTSRIEEDRARPGGSPAAVLMLADARFPAGGHAHSGGLEGAVTAGTVSDVASLELFLRGRLATAGVVAAGLAAMACAGVTGGASGEVLEAEADARTPSPAQRDASRRQGRALLRAARAAWPSPVLDALALDAGAGRPPHHAIVLGATAASAGCTPAEAAQIAAYLTVTGPASAAVRLLALDPIEVSAAIARLAGAISAAAARGAQSAGSADSADSADSAGSAGSAGDLPYPSAPALDLYAEAHARTEVRLFAS
jgi:urease accessory protein